jgi:hypothetical protein
MRPLGDVAYDAYRQAVSNSPNVNSDDLPAYLPAWLDMPEYLRAAWRAAADAVTTYNPGSGPITVTAHLDEPRTHITPTIAAHVLYESFPGARYAMAAGSFTRALIATIGRADTVHKLKLGLGFPGYVEAVDVVQNRSNGQAYLESIAAKLMTDPEPTYDGPTTEAASEPGVK